MTNTLALMLSKFTTKITLENSGLINWPYCNIWHLIPLKIPDFMVRQKSWQRKRYSGLKSPKFNVIICNNCLRVIRMPGTLHLLWYRVKIQLAENVSSGLTQPEFLSFNLCPSAESHTLQSKFCNLSNFLPPIIKRSNKQCVDKNKIHDIAV